MKKYFASFAFIVLFAGYAAFQYLNSSNVTYAAGGTVAQSASPSAPAPAQTEPVAITQTPAPAQPSPTPTPVPTPVPVPVSTPQGQYVDGTYTGSVENAYYGNVQVQVTVSGGKIADAQFLQYPSDRSTSRYINQQAMPILVQEAIQAQSAQVDGVSGASDTSAAFQQSLASALSQAKS